MAIQQGIKRIRSNSRKIRNARRTIGGYVDAMFAARMMSGWIWGWHWWWGPWGVWGPGWIDISIGIWIIGWDDLDYDWGVIDMAIDVSDLGLDEIIIEDTVLAEADALLDAGDYTLEDTDLVKITEELPHGWDDVTTDLGHDVMERTQMNSHQTPFEPEFEVDTLDDVSPADLGDDFGHDIGGGYDCY